MGALIFSVISVCAYTISSSDIFYDNSTSGSEATTVKDAIDDLYEKSTSMLSATPAYSGKSQRWANGSTTVSNVNVLAGTYTIYVVQGCSGMNGGAATLYNLPPTMTGYSTITEIQEPTLFGDVYYGIYELTFDSDSTFTFTANPNSPNYQVLHYATYIMFEN